MQKPVFRDKITRFLWQYHRDFFDQFQFDSVKCVSTKFVNPIRIPFTFHKSQVLRRYGSHLPLHLQNLQCLQAKSKNTLFCNHKDLFLYNGSPIFLPIWCKQSPIRCSVNLMVWRQLAAGPGQRLRNWPAQIKTNWFIFQNVGTPRNDGVSCLATSSTVNARFELILLSLIGCL